MKSADAFFLCTLSRRRISTLGNQGPSIISTHINVRSQWLIRLSGAKPVSAHTLCDMATQVVPRLSPAMLPATVTGSRSGNNRACSTFRMIVVCKARGTDGGSTSGGALETAAIVGGLVSNPVIGFSLYTLKTTGCGLPPGPGGLLGGLEGVSYLVVAGVVGWSLYTKAKTGSGLPNGPFGLLGAVEGLSYLTLLAILVVFGLQFLDRGYIPGPLPADQCFG